MYLNQRPVQVLDEDIPEPQPAEEPWDDFVARQRAREALQAAREAGERDRDMLRGNPWPRPEQPVRHVPLGAGPNGVRRVAVYDPITGRYEIRDEE